MIQKLITILILALAFFIIARNIYRRFIRPADEDDCDGCGSSCDGCPVMDLKKEINKDEHTSK